MMVRKHHRDCVWYLLANDRVVVEWWVECKDAILNLCSRGVCWWECSAATWTRVFVSESYAYESFHYRTDVD
jgi:hypothetical protein